MKKIGKCKILFLILLLLVACGKKEAELQETQDMRFLFVLGNVVVTDASGATKNVTTGDSLAFSDTISTAADALADVLYGETGFIRIKENSTFSASQVEAGTLLKMDKGNILVALPKLKAGFKIQTPTAVASVRGTTFNVTNDKKGSRVAVTKGTVSLSPVKDGAVLENKSIDLANGQKSPLIDEKMVTLIASNEVSLDAIEMTPEEIAEINDALKAEIPHAKKAPKNVRKKQPDEPKITNQPERTRKTKTKASHVSSQGT